MCFVLACWTGFEAKAMVETLSHKILTGVGTEHFKSLRREHNHVISQEQSTKALYSASVDDLDITGYFFECQEIRLLPRKITKPEIDLLVVGQFAQSLSQ